MNIDEIIKESVDRLPHKTVTKRVHAIGDGGKGAFKVTYNVDVLGNEEQIASHYISADDVDCIGLKVSLTVAMTIFTVVAIIAIWCFGSM